MQLMPGTAREVGVTDSLDPVQNVTGGSIHLARQLREFQGDLPLALAAYNAGPGAVRRYGGIPPYQETRDFVDKVIYYRRHFQRGSNPPEPTTEDRGIAEVVLTATALVNEAGEIYAISTTERERAGRNQDEGSVATGQGDRP